MFKLMFGLVVAFGLSGHVEALEDTHENRLAQAKRYMELIPMENMTTEMTEQVAMSMPEDQRKVYVALMNDYLDIERLTAVSLDLMVNVFSADELAALADFYGSEIGQSATKKYGTYMAQATPIIQEELLRAFKQAMEDGVLAPPKTP